MTNEELHHLLVECFADPSFERTYNKRWDVWLITNGHIPAYVMLLQKEDAELNAILDRARFVASTPLMKALS